MLGQARAGVRSTSAQRAKHTRHTEFSREFPAICCTRPNTVTAMFPTEKFQSLQITIAHNVPKQGAASRHINSTQEAEPPSLYDGPSTLHSKQHTRSFQHVFRVPNHLSMHRLQLQNYDDSHESRKPNAPNAHSTHTHCLTIPQTFDSNSTQFSRRSDGQVARILTATHCRLTVITRFVLLHWNSLRLATSAHWLRNQLTCASWVGPIAMLCTLGRRVQLLPCSRPAICWSRQLMMLVRRCSQVCVASVSTHGSASL